MYTFSKRLIDIIFSAAGLILFALPILFLGILIKSSSKGPMIYWSKRVGANNKIFFMAKLRTMRAETPELSSNHFPDPQKYFIFFGKFLREMGLDELPQLYNILIGDMSFVGPRPVVLDDHETIFFRKDKNINTLKPGLTGLAQIRGRNKITIAEKIGYDEYYLKNRNLKLDLYILFMTNLYLFKENFKGYNKSGTESTELPFILASKNFFEL